MNLQMALFGITASLRGVRMRSGEDMIEEKGGILDRFPPFDLVLVAVHVDIASDAKVQVMRGNLFSFS